VRLEDGRTGWVAERFVSEEKGQARQQQARKKRSECESDYAFILTPTAVVLADEVSSDDESLRAAAPFVKDAAHLGEVEMVFEMLEASVGVAGDWVSNRVALGDM
jgi:hypothetical protein